LDGAIDVNEVIWELRNGKRDTATARQFLADNAEALRLVREARSKSAADWQVRLSTPVISFVLPTLAPQRALAKMTNGAALYQHALGDDRAAIETIRDGFAIGRHVEHLELGLIPCLVGVAIDALGTTTVEAIAYDLDVTDGDVQATDRQPAAPEQVRALIGELLDETDLDESWRRAMIGDRTMELDTARALCDGQLPFSVSVLAGLGPARPMPVVDRIAAWLLGPAWKLDALRMAEHTDVARQAGLAGNWPAALRQLPPEPSGTAPASSGSRWVSRLLSSSLMSSLERATLIPFRDRAQRRMTAVALALRLYELDHGRRAAALAELVPDYLPAIPRDPFDAGDGPIRYLPGAPSPLLYSVGSNGVDERGLVVSKPERGIDLDAGDQPLFLDADRPMLPPERDESASPPESQPTSTQAVVNDEQIERAERDENE
jgi:hypothetical protein